MRTFLAIGLAAFATSAAGAADTIVVQAGSVSSAYDLLRAGKTQSAIDELNRVSDRNDPARLINLGTAHARMGHATEAKAHFRQAMRSDARAEIELADGSWMDSRAAARLALRRLSTTEVAAR
jgi:Tfp pilus assembly protein PilF